MQVTIPETGFVRLAQVLEVIPIGRTCWWEGVKSGRYPKPVKVSARCTAWKAEDIHSLIKRLSEQTEKIAMDENKSLKYGQSPKIE
jgi:predicted DNA-binding transcriptional regulator AlpA